MTLVLYGLTLLLSVAESVLNYDLILCLTTTWLWSSLGPYSRLHKSLSLVLSTACLVLTAT